MEEPTCLEQGNNQRVQDDPKHTSNSSSLPDRSSDDPSAGWKESSLHRISKNNESLNPRINADNDKKKTLNDCTGQTNFLKMQSAMVAQDALIRAGYDMQGFYGWLPGYAPVRLPAFIYPPSFFGFAPNVALDKNDSSNGSHRNTAADQWKDDNKDETPTSEEAQDTSEESEQQNEEHEFSSVTDYSTDALVKDIRSDEDEGFGREETDLEKAPNSLKRGRSLEEDEHFQPQRRVISVIQENCSFQKPMEDSQSDTASQCSNLYEPTRRGRASTRQIEKTDQYWDRRKKNNVSAKKSRDARRQREIITNQRSSMLETENLRLRAEVATLRDENQRMKKEMRKK